MAVLKTSETSDFFTLVANAIEQARKFVGRTADLTMTVTYFEVGRMIVEKEQGGQERAEYGQNLIKRLSEFLTAKFKKGFSEVNLKNARLFYNIYSKKLPKSQTLSAELQDNPKSQTPSDFFPYAVQNQVQQVFSTGIDGYEIMQQAAQFFKLGWSHYTFLMRIENEDER
ncbi:MAG: DUF1016 N-terminal domain-containing protein, partial [Fibromonadaceae bacterium]|nr:DUF1016 N-terminal domain-containing protein [Fibromonadaceae bacterium]